MGIKAMLNFLTPSLKQMERMEERGELDEENIKPILDMLMEAVLPAEVEPKNKLSILLNELIYETQHGLIADVASRMVISECERNPQAMRDKLQQMNIKILAILVATQGEE